MPTLRLTQSIYRASSIMFERVDEFEINVGGQVIKFHECAYKADGVLVFFEISISKCSVEFFSLSYINRTTGKYTIDSKTMTFAELKNHMQNVVPENAKNRGIEPFSLSQIHEATKCPYEEAVTLYFTGAGDCDDIAIEMPREPDARVVRSYRDGNEKRIRMLSGALKDIEQKLMSMSNM